MATRARKSVKVAEEKKEANTLLQALEFVALAQKNIGTYIQTHCIVRDGWAVASGNALTMGCPVPDDLTSCPQTSRMIAALRRCGDTVSLTQIDADRISVKSGALRVVVPCVALESMIVSWADPPIAALGEPFRDACRAISHLAADGGVAVHLASLLGRGQTLTATTGRVVLEYWHGFDMPPYWVLPKPAVTALIKIAKPLVGFGFSGRSATFHFEDKSWLRTQLFEDKWPNVDKLFEQTSSNRTPIPDTLFTSIDVLSDFAQPGAFVRFKDDMIEVIAGETEKAEHAVSGLRGGLSFGLKDLQQISKLAKTLDCDKAKDKAAVITGERLRGALSIHNDSYSDDVPF